MLIVAVKQVHSDAGFCACLFVQGGDMPFHRPLGQEQAVGYLLGAAVRGNHLGEHIPFPFGQPVPTLPMKREGSKSHLRSKLPTMKFVCPKMKWEYNPADKSKCRVCHCDNPCTTSSCGRMIYIYPEKNLRAYPGVERGSQEWEDTYKIRVNVEKSINHFKDSFCIANRKTQNEKTLHADLLLAGITQLITVLVADKIHQLQYIRSLKPLIA